MPPVSTMPDAETALLLEAYAGAQVILEYGSGASTRLAAAMPGKYILSVESDRAWARDLRRTLALEQPQALATIWHVDIGPTGAWGRPLDDSGWRRYHEYPNSIWDQPFFRPPDVILIDGRFRPACLIAAMLHISRPVRVLFDDYAPRPAYHCVERLVRPLRRAGRMAEFHLTPGMIPPEQIGFALSRFSVVTQAPPRAPAAPAPPPAVATAVPATVSTAAPPRAQLPPAGAASAVPVPPSQVSPAPVSSAPVSPARS